MYRSVADSSRTEKVTRERIAQQYPALHQSETRARAGVQQTQAARVQQQTRRYEPPAPTRSGPKLGR